VADDGLLAALYDNPVGLLPSLIHAEYRAQFRDRLRDFEQGGELSDDDQSAGQKKEEEKRRKKR